MDLDRFAVHLSTDFPQIAARVGAALRDRSRLLETHPLIGVSLGGDGRYRRLVVRVLRGFYSLDYRIDGERIVILQALHSRERR